MSEFLFCETCRRDVEITQSGECPGCRTRVSASGAPGMEATRSTDESNSLPSNYRISALCRNLGFSDPANGRVFGELSGTPIAMSILTSAPEYSTQLVLMFQFRVNPDGTERESLRALLKGVPEDQCELSFDGDCAWLTMYQAGAVPNEVIQAFVRCFADTLAATDLAVEAGCLKCGDAESARLMLLEGRATRLCPGCVSQAIQERAAAEARLNRPTLVATLGLPAVIGYVAAGWAVLWTVADFVLEFFQIEVVIIGAFTLAAYLALAVGVGWALGRPLGKALRQSLALNRAPLVTAPLVALGAVVAGEISYMALWLVRSVGVFDLRAAAGMAGQFVSNYSAFWITCKLGILIAIAILCVISACERQSVRLEI